MAESALEQNIRQALAQVRHPEITSTLAELGMIKDVAVQGNKVVLTLAFPFMGIPVQVKDYLINSLHQALTNVDASLEVQLNLVEMNQEERSKFFKMAQEGWIG